MNLFLWVLLMIPTFGAAAEHLNCRFPWTIACPPPNTLELENHISLMDTSVLTTLTPTFEPTTTPTVEPTQTPAFKPTSAPTFNPTLTPVAHTYMPTTVPSIWKEQKNNKMSNGQIAAAVIGSVAGAAFFTVVSWYIFNMFFKPQPIPLFHHV